MVCNVSSGPIMVNFSDNLTQEELFLEILVPLSAPELRLSNENLMGHEVTTKVISVVQKRTR